jgi:hypothetical protein
VPTFHLKRLRSATAEETDRLRKRLRIGRARDFLDIPVEDNPFALEHGHVIMESERGEFEAWAPMIEWHWNVTPEDEYGGFVATCRASILEVEGRQTEAAAVLTAELKRTAVQGDEHWFWRSLMQDFLAGMSARSKSDGEGDEATS